MEIEKSKRITILGKEIDVKNYICSINGGGYKEKEGTPKIQVTICPTSFCMGNCAFCIARTSADKETYEKDTYNKKGLNGDIQVSSRINLKILENTLYQLKAEDIVRGISITGGEPFSDVKLLNEVISLVFAVFGKSMEISLNTNGYNLHRMHEIKDLSYLDTIHISRHHYDDKRVQELFNIKDKAYHIPGKEELTEIISSVSYKDLFVLNCLLFKNYIGTPEEAHKYLEHAMDIGVGKVAFISPVECNDFVRREKVKYEEVIRRDDPDMLFLRNFEDYNICHCQDGLYMSKYGGRMIEFYGRETFPYDCPYSRGLVYGADNVLRDGFQGTVILKN